MNAQRFAYWDPEHEVHHLRRVYDAKLKEGNAYTREAREKSGMAGLCFEQAQRILEQLEVAEAEMERLRA